MYNSGIFQYGNIGGDDDNSYDNGYSTEDIVTMTPFNVNETRIPDNNDLQQILDNINNQNNNIFNTDFTGGGGIGIGGGNGGISVNLIPPESTPSSNPIQLPPVVVNENRIPTIGREGGIIDTGMGQLQNIFSNTANNPVQMPPVVVNENRINDIPPVNQPIDTASIIRQIQSGVNPAVSFPSSSDGIVTMPPFIVTPGPTLSNITVPPITIPSLPEVTVPNYTGTITSAPTTTPVTTVTPRVTITPAVTPSVTPTPIDPAQFISDYGINAAQSLTTKRDFAKELEATLAGLKGNQAGIMSMYTDLYNQFMPKGISQNEAGVIDQYKTDLARLQQRQAGVLSPEDVRQSQQAAREAYGARGQVMGRGAVGAEILNREAIRQQREDQARAGMQSSYGNVLNMANLQTGNIFQPIGNLMSSTFNPLGAYPSDVYGTNVNAQLAKEIAQKNYDAAVRSAELQGSAVKSASNTGIFGNLIQAGAGIKVAMLCMPGYQEIDTPNGPVPIEELRGGDYVIGYDNTVKRIEQLCSYVEKPESEFLEFTLADGGKITVCGPHKILDIPAREWVIGSEMNGVKIVDITKVTGITTSYDLLTDVGGYRIAGIPVNSMIPEMITQTIKQILLNRS
jgi:hypothetical protein